MSRTYVTLGDERWVFDEDDLDLNDAFLIKSTTGLNMRDFFVGLTEMDPRAMQAIVWFLRRKNGENVPIESVNFKLTALGVEQEEDPTEGSATPSESSETN